MSAASTEEPPPRGTAIWRDACARLEAYLPQDAEQERWRGQFLAALREQSAAFKSGPPAHLTASCVVLDRARERVLLTLHGKAHRWLQFGGHLEVDDAGLVAAAEREVAEESGLGSVVVDPQILELHRHELGPRFGRCREHLDVRFVGWAPDGAEPVRSPESLDVRWWPIADLPAETVADLGILIARAQQRRPLRSAQQM
ncbi:MAG: NUDIX domain-containing protein [Actinomycetia bacterium]|nr:NUDIX domain-containing protein [Actinomycetes bacterium]